MKYLVVCLALACDNIAGMFVGAEVCPAWVGNAIHCALMVAAIIAVEEKE